MDLQRYDVISDDEGGVDEFFAADGYWVKAHEAEAAIKGRDDIVIESIGYVDIAESSRNKAIAKLGVARVRIAELEKTISNALNVMGPNSPKCCQGCKWEWDEALAILRSTPEPPKEGA